jgi:hypothetical protein
MAAGRAFVELGGLSVTAAPISMSSWSAAAFARRQSSLEPTIREHLAHTTVAVITTMGVVIAPTARLTALTRR